jgi:hypothetical protein
LGVGGWGCLLGLHRDDDDLIRVEREDPIRAVSGLPTAPKGQSHRVSR